MSFRYNIRTARQGLSFIGDLLLRLLTSEKYRMAQNSKFANAKKRNHRSKTARHKGYRKGLKIALRSASQDVPSYSVCLLNGSEVVKQLGTFKSGLSSEELKSNVDFEKISHLISNGATPTQDVRRFIEKCSSGNLFPSSTIQINNIEKPHPQFRFQKKNYLDFNWSQRMANAGACSGAGVHPLQGSLASPVGLASTIKPSSPDFSDDSLTGAGENANRSKGSMHRKHVPENSEVRSKSNMDVVASITQIISSNNISLDSSLNDLH